LFTTASLIYHVLRGLISHEIRIHHRLTLKAVTRKIENMHVLVSHPDYNIRDMKQMSEIRARL
jgi:hypothetical protein